MSYLAYFVVLIAIYAILGSALNLVAGFAGYVSVGHAALYGVGAYLAAYVSLRWGLGILETIPIVLAAGAALGYALAWLTTRSRDDFFVLLTLACQLIASSLFANLEITGGTMGLSGIRPCLVTRGDPAGPLVIGSAGLVLALGSLFACAWIMRSPLGRIVLAVREDERVLLAFGKNVGASKATLFAASAALATTAGALYAFYARFVDPTSFSVMESVFLLTIVVLGGPASICGPLLGAILLVMVPEILRVLHLSPSVVGNLRQIILGFFLIAVLMFRPRGLIGKYAFLR